jgi:hypothetical protein
MHCLCSLLAVMTIAATFANESFAQERSSAEANFYEAQGVSDSFQANNDRATDVQRSESQNVAAKAKVSLILQLATLGKPNKRLVIGESPNLERISPGEGFRVQLKTEENGDEVSQSGPLFYETADSQACQAQLVETYSWGFVFDSTKDELAVRCYSTVTHQQTKAFRVVRTETGIRLLELKGWNSFSDSTDVR